MSAKTNSLPKKKSSSKSSASKKTSRKSSASTRRASEEVPEKKAKTEKRSRIITSHRYTTPESFAVAKRAYDMSLQLMRKVLQSSKDNRVLWVLGVSGSPNASPVDETHKEIKKQYNAALQAWNNHHKEDPTCPAELGKLPAAQVNWVAREVALLLLKWVRATHAKGKLTAHFMEKYKDQPVLRHKMNKMLKCGSICVPGDYKSSTKDKETVILTITEDDIKLFYSHFFDEELVGKFPVLNDGIFVPFDTQGWRTKIRPTEWTRTHATSPYYEFPVNTFLVFPNLKEMKKYPILMKGNPYIDLRVEGPDFHKTGRRIRDSNPEISALMSQGLLLKVSGGKIYIRGATDTEDLVEPESPRALTAPYKSKRNDHLIGVDLGINNPFTISDGQRFGADDALLKKVNHYREKRDETQSRRVRERNHVEARIKNIQAHLDQGKHYATEESREKAKNAIKVLEAKAAELQDVSSREERLTAAITATMRGFSRKCAKDMIAACQAKHSGKNLVFVVEDISMEGMRRRNYRYKSIHLETLKNELKGRAKVITVPAPYTSQTCSSCGVVEKSNRRQEDYKCSSCGLEIHADVNAAINVMRRASDTEIMSLTDEASYMAYAEANNLPVTYRKKDGPGHIQRLCMKDVLQKRWKKTVQGEEPMR